MQKLVFERMVLDHFRSFNEPVVLNFVDRLGPGLHFLRGVTERFPRLDGNGAGKSSMWDGLLWILYGRTAAGLRNTDVVPWNGAKGTRGILDLRLDASKYRIVRKANPNALLLNGKDVGQAAIDKLLGFALPVLTNAMIFPQGRPLFFDLEPRRKLELFDEVLNLDRWLKRSMAAGKKVESRSKIEAQIIADLEVNEREQDSIERTRDDLQRKARQWESERGDRIEQEQDRLDQAKQRRGVLLEDRDKADLQLENTGTNLKFLRTDIAKAERRYNQLMDQLGHQKIKQEVAIIEIRRLKDLLRMQGECPTCGQEIRRAEDHKDHIKDNIRELLRVRVSDELISELAESRRVLKRLITAKDDFEAKQADAHDIFDRVGPEVAALEATMAAAQRAIDGHAEEINPYNDQAADLRRRMAELKSQQRDDRESLNKIRRKIERATFWVQGFKDIRLLIIDEVLDELELTTNTIVEAMGLLDWEVRFDIEKQTLRGDVNRALHVTILSPDNDKAVKWESFSGGEAQRLRLAGSLALGEVLMNRAGVTSNLEVLDEPSRGMSRGGIGDLCDYLAERAEQQRKVIVLTDHHALSAGRFKSVLTVVKDAKGSHLER